MGVEHSKGYLLLFFGKLDSYGIKFLHPSEMHLVISSVCSWTPPQKSITIQHAFLQKPKTPLSIRVYHAVRPDQDTLNQITKFAKGAPAWEPGRARSVLKQVINNIWHQSSKKQDKYVLFKCSKKWRKDFARKTKGCIIWGMQIAESRVASGVRTGLWSSQESLPKAMCFSVK